MAPAIGSERWLTRAHNESYNPRRMLIVSLGNARVPGFSRIFAPSKSALWRAVAQPRSESSERNGLGGAVRRRTLLSANTTGDENNGPRQDDADLARSLRRSRCRGWRPGDTESTRRALQLLYGVGLESVGEQFRVLDMGCGNGAQTLCLAAELGCRVTAVDNHQPYWMSWCGAPGAKDWQTGSRPTART